MVISAYAAIEHLFQKCAGRGALRVTGRVPGCGPVDLQSRDESPLHPASTTYGRKRGSLTGP